MSSASAHARIFLEGLLYPDLRSLLDSQSNPVCPKVEDPGQNFVVCPYKDARLDHPLRMNSTSLGVLQENLPSLLQVVSKMASGYAFHNACSPLCALDVWRIWAMIYSLPVLWIASQPKDQTARIPTTLSVVYKVSIGFLDTLSGLLMYVHADDARRTVESEGAFFEFLDFNKLLIGPREVCAGSPGMIKHLMKNVLDVEAQEPGSMFGVSFASSLHLAEILLTSMLARLHLRSLCSPLCPWEWESPILDSCFIMRPRVRMRRLKQSSALEVHHRSLLKNMGQDEAHEPLAVWHAVTQRHLRALASALLQLDVEISLEDYATALRLWAPATEPSVTCG